MILFIGASTANVAKHGGIAEFGPAAEKSIQS